MKLVQEDRWPYQHKQTLTKFMTCCFKIDTLPYGILHEKWVKPLLDQPLLDQPLLDPIMQISCANYNKRLKKIVMESCHWVLFHQDNAPAHKSAVALATVHDCDF